MQDSAVCILHPIYREAGGLIYWVTPSFLACEHLSLLLEVPILGSYLGRGASPVAPIIDIVWQRPPNTTPLLPRLSTDVRKVGCRVLSGTYELMEVQAPQFEDP